MDERWVVIGGLCQGIERNALIQDSLCFVLLGFFCPLCAAQGYLSEGI